MVFILLAAATGALSGFLANYEMFAIPALAFAAAVIAASLRRYRVVGVLRMLGIVAVSVVANSVAVQTAIATSSEVNELISGAFAGAAGGALLGLGLGLVLRLRPLLGIAGLLALTGGALGAVFFVLPHPAIAFAVWQGGVMWALQRWWDR